MTPIHGHCPPNAGAGSDAPTVSVHTKKAGSRRLSVFRVMLPQPKFFSAKLQFTSLSRKVSTYFGR
ncbi:MAG TPA: hypothetical protein VN617_04335, partial [Rhodoferax sp.]|nr:hypothetical protein [Rhodoferax sp.]